MSIFSSIFRSLCFPRLVTFQYPRRKCDNTLNVASSANLVHDMGMQVGKKSVSDLRLTAAVGARLKNTLVRFVYSAANKVIGPGVVIVSGSEIWEFGRPPAHVKSSFHKYNCAVPLKNLHFRHRTHSKQTNQPTSRQASKQKRQPAPTATSKANLS